MTGVKRQHINNELSPHCFKVSQIDDHRPTRTGQAEITLTEQNGEKEKRRARHSRVGVNNLLPITSQLLKPAMYVGFKGLRNVRTLFSMITHSLIRSRSSTHRVSLP